MATASPGTAPVGGAALDQVIGLTLGAGVVTLILVWIAWQHRTHRIEWLQNFGDWLNRRFGASAWLSVSTIFVAIALVTALLGYLWDVSLHAGRGRDEGPLANPAHYFILVGLFSVFIAGMTAIIWSRDGERPSRSSIKITRQWYAPVSAIFLASTGIYALIGFPLDDVWHRLFGQDVTLWGPTHLMLIGGAGAATAGIILMIRESEADEGALAQPMPIWLRNGLLGVAFGGLLIGLSVFQGEFDFGIAQFRLVFAPMLIALPAALALVAARLYVGPGVALIAAGFFLGVRGVVSFIVTDVFGQAHHVFPLYLGSAVLIEVLALTKLKQKPLVFGAVAGLLVGTVGTAIEKVWNDSVFPFPWPQDIWGETLLMTVPVAVGAGLCGALFAMALNGQRPKTRWVGRTIVTATVLTIAAATANGLYATVPKDASATFELQQVGMPDEPEVIAKVTLSDGLIDDDPAWVQITAWQGGHGDVKGVVLDNLERTGPNTWESTKPVPVYGNWKTLLRLQDGRMLAAVPIFLAEDEALGAEELPAEPSFTRAVVPEIEILQRERDLDVPAWSWGVANLVVLLCSLAIVAGWAWTAARVSQGVVTSRAARTPDTD